MHLSATHAHTRIYLSIDLGVFVSPLSLSLTHTHTQTVSECAVIRTKGNEKIELKKQRYVSQ